MASTTKNMIDREIEICRQALEDASVKSNAEELQKFIELPSLFKERFPSLYYSWLSPNSVHFGRLIRLLYLAEMGRWAYSEKCNWCGSNLEDDAYRICEDCANPEQS
jgi:hypothetical protein